MPATNYTPILLYRTATASTTAPAAGNLNFGELAINYNASGMILYAKNASGSVIKLMNNPANLLYPTADGSPNHAIVTNGSGTLSFASVTTSPGGSTTQVQYNNAGAFAGSANFVFDGTNVGIGTTNPLARLVVSNSSNENFEFSTGNVSFNGGIIEYINRTAPFTTRPDINYLIANSSGVHKFYTSNTERMRITSAGNVGIGTSTAPGSNGTGLAIYASDYPRLTFRNSTTGDTNADGLQVYMVGNDVTYALTETGYQRWTTSNAERMRLDSAGNLGLGATPSANNDFSPVFQNGRVILCDAPTGTRRALLSYNYERVSGTNKYIGSDYASFYQQANGEHQWATAPSGTAGNTPTFTTAMTLNANGGLQALNTISVGNATPSTSGAGITFPATQSASSDANTLDDYEEGTWTPSIGGNATYDNQEGKYTKVGRVVTVSMFLSVNTIGTGSTSTISGLPFQAGDYSSGSIAYWNQAAASYVYMAPLTSTGSSSITFYGATAAASGISALSPITSGTDFRLTITYFV